MIDRNGLPKTGFVTPHWVKLHYSISNSTMYAWTAANILPPMHRIGPRAMRFKVEELLEFEAKFLARNQERR